MSAEEPDRAKSLEIADPDDYNQTRRLRQIHSARERVETAILEGREDVAERSRDPADYNEFVAESLLLYIIQVEPILTSPTLLGDTKNGDEPRQEGRFWHPIEIDGERLEERIETEDGEKLSLKQILDDDAEIDERVLTVSESRKAYRLVNRFLGEVGFGLPFDDGLPEDEL